MLTNNPNASMDQSGTNDFETESDTGCGLFPDPSARINLRDCATYRAVDDDDQPVLVITDGVTTVTLECGLQGPTPALVTAAGRLSGAVGAFATLVAGII